MKTDGFQYKNCGIHLPNMIRYTHTYTVCEYYCAINTIQNLTQYEMKDQGPPSLYLFTCSEVHNYYGGKVERWEVYHSPSSSDSLIVCGFTSEAYKVAGECRRLGRKHKPHRPDPSNTKCATFHRLTTPRNTELEGGLKSHTHTHTLWVILPVNLRVGDSNERRCSQG